VSPDRPEPDDFLEDEEQEEYGQRSIFATGWFRAVLVLLVLAVVGVIAVPLIGGWFEPTPPPKVITKPSEPPPSTLVPVPSTPPPASQTPSAAAPPAAPPPAAAPAPAVQPPPTSPPAVSSPAPAPARPEMPPASTPKAAEKTKAPERTAAVTPPSKSATKPAAPSGNYWVQVGAFKESGNAEGLVRKLRSEGFSALVTRVTREEPLHVVRVGGYPDRSRAVAAREELQGKGHTGFVTSGPVK
jgi:cell division protein FtsN